MGHKATSYARRKGRRQAFWLGFEQWRAEKMALGGNQGWLYQRLFETDKGARAAWRGRKDLDKDIRQWQLRGRFKKDWLYQERRDIDDPRRIWDADCGMW